MVCEIEGTFVQCLNVTVVEEVYKYNSSLFVPLKHMLRTSILEHYSTRQKYVSDSICTVIIVNSEAEITVQQSGSYLQSGLSRNL